MSRATRRVVSSPATSLKEGTDVDDVEESRSSPCGSRRRISQQVRGAEGCYASG